MGETDELTRKITDISSQKKNKERVNIYLDGEYAFSLNLITAAKLSIGQELDQAAIEELLSEDTVELAKQRVFRFISYRPRSIREVEQYLAKKGYDETTTDLVVKRLIELEMLDDHEFTRYWIEQRETFKPRSRRALQYELFRLGVDRSIVDEAVNQVDEKAAAYRAATKRMNTWRHYSFDDFKAKMIPYLQRRGFNFTTANSVTSTIWQELQEDGQHN